MQESNKPIIRYPTELVSTKASGRQRRRLHLQVGEAPKLAQAGEVAGELRGVRLVDPGGWRGRCGGGGGRVLSRSLAWRHWLFKKQLERGVKGLQEGPTTSTSGANARGNARAS